MRSSLLLAAVAAALVAVVSADVNLKVRYGPISQTLTNPCNGKSVSYSAPAADVVNGQSVPSFQTQSQPWVTWTYDPTKYYTLQLQDVEGKFTHFFLPNIVPPSVSFAGSELLPYFPPLNPTTTVHHYTWYLYEQPGFVNISQALQDKIASNPLFVRANFPYEQFVEDNSLTLLASVANNGVVDQWTPYMWGSMLDAPFLTSAEKSAFSGYYAQACMNYASTDMSQYEVEAPVEAEGAGFSVVYGKMDIGFKNPCTNRSKTNTKSTCPIGNCQGAQTASTPWITWNVNSTKRYTVILYDKTGQFMHTMFTNVIGGSVSFASNELFPYMPPLNPAATPNQYTWMLYEQTNWYSVPQSLLNEIAQKPITSRFGFDYASITSGMKLLASVENLGHVTPWTAYMLEKLISSPRLPFELDAAFKPLYSQACANY